ncbi:MAG: hypothetical protein OXN17_18800 [Candidatus Poribacteria bacterium]|nr:hypothetical protein [Candidatus Poribacteria bacterium]
MRIHESRFPNSAAPVGAAIIILLSLNFTASQVRASSPWVEVHPPDIEEFFTSVRLIHFADADIGFAEVYGRHSHWPEDWFNIVLRATDGGQTWRRDAPVGGAFGFGIHFISPTVGWRTIKYPEKTAPPGLLADPKIFSYRRRRLDMEFAARQSHRTH